MVDVVFGQKYWKTCSRCGKEMKRAAKYCLSCRKEVDKELQKKFQEIRKEERRNKSLIS